MMHAARVVRHRSILVNVGAPLTRDHCEKIAGAYRSRAKELRDDARAGNDIARAHRAKSLNTARSYYAIARRIDPNG